MLYLVAPLTTLFKAQVGANTALQSSLPFQRAVSQATVAFATSDD